MRVAVLGANGFIGSRLVEQWHLESIAEIVPIVRRPEAAAGAMRFGLDCRVADALDEVALADAFAGCDAVVHSAAGDKRLVTRSPMTVANAARHAGVRKIVYLSSMAVHGWSPSGRPDETSPLPVRHALPYNAWKARAERILARTCAARGVDVVVLRPGIVYGPRSAWITRFARTLLDGSAVVVDGGRGTCNAIYVDNLLHAIHLSLEFDGPAAAFLVSDAEAVTWADFHEPVARALGVPWTTVHDVHPRGPRRTPRERALETRDARPVQALVGMLPTSVRMRLAHRFEQLVDEHLHEPVVDLESSILQTCTYRFPIERARRLLGYRPRLRFEEGMERTLAWLRYAGYGPAGVEGGAG
jgi:2-alkyl-3-oxoalkanoate reductase